MLRFLCFVVCFAAFAQKKFNLNQCIELAIKHNRPLEQQKLNQGILENQGHQLSQNRLPTLAGSASQGLNFGRSIDPFSNVFVAQSINSNSFGLSSSLRIYDGFANQYKIRQNKYLLENNAYNQKNEERDLKIAICLAYMQVLLNKELLKAAKTQKTGVERLTTQTKELVQNGLQPATALLEIEAQQAAVNYEIKNQEFALKKAFFALKQSLSWASKEELDIEDVNISEIKINDKPIISTQNQPRILAAMANFNAAKMAYEVAKAASKPTVSLNGGLFSGFSNVGTNRFLSQIGNNINQNLNLGLNLPFLDNGATRANMKTAGITLKIAQSQLEETKLATEQQIEELKLTFDIAQTRLSAAEIQKNIQQKVFESAQERFTIGIVSLLDLNAYISALEKAKTDLIQAKYEVYFRRLAWDYY